MHKIKKILIDNGSSPRVRGTLLGKENSESQCRIIPACAGNSRPHGRACAGRPDHPRVCGELRQRDHPPAVALGSSPRVRGTHRGRVAGRIGDRIIPACAGNSQRQPCAPRWRPDHPRVCGELSCGHPTTGRPFGSSPRVRGTRLARPAMRAERRIIPACAGNSLPGSD